MRHLRDQLIVTMLVLVLAPALLTGGYLLGQLDELLTQRSGERLALLGERAQARYLQGRRAGQSAEALAAALAGELPELLVCRIDSAAVTVDTAVAVLRLGGAWTRVSRAVWDGVAETGAALMAPATLFPAETATTSGEAQRLMLWHAPDGNLLVLARSEEQEAAWRRQAWREALAWSGVFVAGALALALLLAWRFTRPILLLQGWAEAVERGEALTPLPVMRRDEIGRLADTLVQMGARLGEQIATLNELRAYDELLIESMTGGLVTLEPDGRVRAINARARQLLALPAAAASGRPFREVLAGCPNLVTMMGEVLRRGNAVPRAELTERLPDGEKVFGISSSCLRDAAGALRGTAFFFQDLTATKRLEEQARQQEKLVALGEMAAAVAHEVRNPLNPIRGFAQLLKTESDPAEVREYASIIIAQVDALRRVVDNLLHYARLPGVEWRELDIAELIAQTLALYRPRLATNAVRVTCACPAPLWWCSGEVQVRLIVDNLVRNAVNVLRPGGELRITASCADDHLKLTVADDGPGIAAEHLPRLFTAFFTTRAQGTGLGLAIVKKMTDDLHGEVTVSSRVGQGTEFTVRLPRRVAP